MSDLAILRGRMRPVQLVVEQGPAGVWSCVLLDGDTRQPIALAGEVLTLTVRVDLDSPDPIVELDSAGLGGITIADQVAAPGEFTVATDALVVLAQTEHLWDLWIDDEILVPPSPMPVVSP